MVRYFQRYYLNTYSYFLFKLSTALYFFIYFGFYSIQCRILTYCSFSNTDKKLLLILAICFSFFFFFSGWLNFLNYRQKEKEKKQTNTLKSGWFTISSSVSEWNGAYLTKQLWEFHIPPRYRGLSRWHSAYMLRFIVIHSERIKEWLMSTYCKFQAS